VLRRFEMEKILILGGAKGQVPIIESAKEQGYYVVLCDWTTTNPGIALADKHYQVSTLDKVAVLNVARLEKVHGVVSNSEPAMETVAYVAEKLGLIGNREESIRTLLSKKEFRVLQSRAGFFAPCYAEANSLEEFRKVLEGFPRPLIIKPSKSSGSRGTTFLDTDVSDTFLDNVFMECSTFSRDGCVTVEEYVPMPDQMVVEGDVFVLGERILWDGLFFDWRNPVNPMIPMTNLFPLNIDREKQEKIREVVQCLLREAGIEHGEYNVELYFTHFDEPFVIEINARQGGNQIPKLIHRHCGIDMYKLLVTTSMGDFEYWEEIQKMKRECRFIAKHILFSREDGVFEKVWISEEIKEWIEYIDLYVNPGDHISKMENASDAIGIAVFNFPNYELQHQYGEEMERFVAVVIKGDSV